MSAHQMPRATCPACGRIANGATSADDIPDRPPRGGDFTICSGCAAVLLFDDDLLLRHASVSEIDALEGADRDAVINAQAQVRQRLNR